MAQKTLARCRFYYCSASVETDQTPELRKIEMQPRRDPGTVTSKKATAAKSAGSAATGGPGAKP